MRCRPCGGRQFPVAPRIANRLYAWQVILRNLVREARKRAGLTQAELGRRAGVPQSTIARIESGARTPSTDMVERLVRAAGFEPRVTLGEPDPETVSLFSQTLRRTPAQRLADATRAARFVLRGRQQLRERSRG
ncbi:MAG: helix-turn-helix transcriptional regulator [Acidobacteria bacterium]|nr:helix-turn-helix transcriptional regulator [Acidobacteriota bacterium]